MPSAGTEMTINSTMAIAITQSHRPDNAQFHVAHPRTAIIGSDSKHIDN